MGQSPAKPPLPQFGIQLTKIDVSEVFYSCDGFSDPSASPADTFDLAVGVSPYDSESKYLQVGLTFNSESSADELNSRKYDYKLRVTITGQFRIDETRVPQLNGPEAYREWGSRNGAMILMSFLRETVHSFTQKTGFKPFIIPLVEVAAFKVLPPDEPSGAPKRKRSKETASS